MIAYKTVQSAEGQLVFVKRVEQVGYQEMVTIIGPTGTHYQGQVIALDKDLAIVQIFSNPAGFETKGAQAIFLGETKKFALSPTLLGRVFKIGRASCRERVLRLV